MSILSGKEFNKLYYNKDFYKCINPDYKHYNFTYKHGLNIDILPFQPIEECLPGGLYFTEFDKLFMYVDPKCYICKVTIPDDASVYIEKNKFKTDRIFVDLNNKIKLGDLPHWNDIDFCNNSVKQYGWLLKYVKEEFQTKELCEIAVLHGGNGLEYVCDKFHTEELYKLALKKAGCALQYVKKNLKTEELCLIAVKQYWWAIIHIDEHLQTEEICKIALDKTAATFKYICERCQTEEICKMAIKNDPYIVYHIHKNKLTENLCNFYSEITGKQFIVK